MCAMYTSVVTSRTCLELLVCAAVNPQLQLLRELERLKSSSIAITTSCVHMVSLSVIGQHSVFRRRRPYQQHVCPGIDRYLRSPQFSRTTPIKNLGQLIASRCSPPVQFGRIAMPTTSPAPLLMRSTQLKRRNMVKAMERFVERGPPSIPARGPPSHSAQYPTRGTQTTAAPAFHTAPIASTTENRRTPAQTAIGQTTSLQQKK
ncbi:hypothetical protein EDB84DRAFT_1492446 [Lactarius hengduanensis]|nr:hypothetical protein EDB84DRAFT_1492446 [Lactarius hengduanensis]